MIVHVRLITSKNLSGKRHENNKHSYSVVGAIFMNVTLHTHSAHYAAPAMCGGAMTFDHVTSVTSRYPE